MARDSRKNNALPEPKELTVEELLNVFMVFGAGISQRFGSHGEVAARINLSLKEVGVDEITFWEQLLERLEVYFAAIKSELKPGTGGEAARLISNLSVYSYQIELVRGELQVLREAKSKKKS